MNLSNPPIMRQSSNWRAPVVLFLLLILHPNKLNAFVRPSNTRYGEHVLREGRLAEFPPRQHVISTFGALKMSYQRDGDFDDDSDVIVQPSSPKNMDTIPNSDESNPPIKELRWGPLGSLEVLAAVVSLFFAATVFLAGDALFAAPSQSTPPKFDADEVLRQDFVRMETSVPFE